MTNKTLLRIIRKTFGARSNGELVALLDERRSQVTAPEAKVQFNDFADALLDCLETVDAAITDLDRVIDIRDRSLAISSKELTALNEQISDEAAKQRDVLDELQGILRLLSENSDGVEFKSVADTDVDAEKSNLTALVAKVDQLVKNQMNSARNLKNLFEEGLRVSSAMDFKSLESQLQESALNILGVGVNIKIYFAASLFGRRSSRSDLADDEANKYYSCNASNEPDEELSARSSLGQSFQIVSSSKSNGILAFAKMSLQSQAEADFESAAQVIAEYWTRLQPLLPNVATTLENIRLLQDEKHRQRIETELQTARFVQQALLPPSEPLALGNALEVCGFYQNASECGGDWWSHIKMADGRHVVFVGDVTGHGTASAMVCAVVKGYCDSFSDRSGIALSSMLEELNEVVYRVGSDAGRAMTMAAIAFDPQKGELTLVNAGHPPPIRIRYNDEAKGAKGVKSVVQYLIAPTGTILGLNEKVVFKEKTFPLKKNDAIILYSDGVIEYTRHNREVYGDRRLYRVAALASGVNSTAYELNQAVIRDLQEFALGDEPSDDVTAVVIKAI